MHPTRTNSYLSYNTNNKKGNVKSVDNINVNKGREDKGNTVVTTTIAENSEMLWNQNHLKINRTI